MPPRPDPAPAPDSWRHRLLVAGGLVLGVLVLATVGIVSLLLNTLTPFHSAPSGAASPSVPSAGLQEAVCRGSVDDIRATVARMSLAQTVELPGALRYCVVEADASGERFRALLPLFAAGRAPLTQASATAQREFCASLVVLHEARRVDLLATLADASFAITCPVSPDRRPVWFAGLSPEVNAPKPIDAATQARMLAWLQFLRSRGVDLGERGGYGNACMLDHVIGTASAEIVLLALDAGCDPRAVPSALYEWPAVTRWTVRRHLAPECSTSVPLSPKQVAAIAARMPALRPEDVNLAGRSTGRRALHAVADAQRCPDGGAPLFKHLLSYGADLGLGDTQGDTFLSRMQSLHPALEAELRQLSNGQIDRMAHPVRAPSGASARPLLDAARASGNLALVELLCERGVKGCAR
jgi:hypothetical protein